MTANGIPESRRILDWLAAPAGDNPVEEVESLRTHLESLRETPPAPVQLHKVLDLLHERALKSALDLIPRLHHVRLPISPYTRRTTRALQDVLELIAREYLDTVEELDEQLIRGLRRPPNLTLWRAMQALGWHLYVSDLIAAPAGHGIWRQLHRTMLVARKHRVLTDTPEGADCSLLALYQRALLLGCAQPSAFTAHEWSSIERYAARHAALVRFVEMPSAEERAAAFWVNPGEDSGPVPIARRPAPEVSGVVHFVCEHILDLLDKHRRELGKALRAENIGFPDDLPTRLARSLLLRLRSTWGTPRKRHFPRRRQGFRVKLCVGFEDITRLLRGLPGEDPPSEWMVTNESPGGYAVMHVAGKPHKVQIGDLVALRPDDATDWQICIARWALSENPEHLELGLQVLSANARAASVAIGNTPEAERPAALLLPAAAPLRPQPAVATPPGLLMENSGRLVLLLEAATLEVAEFDLASLQEQSPDVDVFAVLPVTSV